MTFAGAEKAEAFRDYWAKRKSAVQSVCPIPEIRFEICTVRRLKYQIGKNARADADWINSGKVRFVHYGHFNADIPENKEFIRI